MDEDKLEILKKTIGHNNIEFNNGQLTIWKIPSMIMTLNSYVLLERISKHRFGKDFSDLVYYLAKQQARAGTEIVHKQFGYKDMKKAVQLEFQTSAMIGLGVCNLERYDEEKKVAIIKINPNPYAKMHKQILGLANEPVDIWSRGGVAGILSYAFDEDMVAIETECQAMGKPSCYIKVKRREEWDLNDPMVKAQMPDLESKYADLIKNLTAKGMRKQ